MNPDTPSELACLERAKMWEGLAVWCEEMERPEIFWCGNLRVEMTAGACQAARREARRRLLAWPEGMGWLVVCHECPVRAAEAPEVGRSASRKPEKVSSFSDSGGTPALKRPKTRNRKPKTQLLKTMSLAVARDLGLI